MAGRAVILRGPSPSAKSFFTVLPDSLEALVRKASDLFPVPPDHTGQLVLDNGAILMPDVLPFINAREVLTFRHAPDTPRSSLHRTGTLGAAREAAGSSAEKMRAFSRAFEGGRSGHAGSDDSVGSSGGSSSSSMRGSRSVRWDESVVSNENKARRTAPVIAKPMRYSAAGRAEHARRVLGEQEQQRRQEEAATTAEAKEAKTSAPSTASSACGKATAPNPVKTSVKTPMMTAESSDKDTFLSRPDAIQSLNNLPFANITSNDLLASGSSPPSYATATSRSRTHSEDEQQGSSPIASPTRNVRSAQKASSEWAKPLGEASKAQASAASVNEEGNKTDETATISPAHLALEPSTSITSDRLLTETATIAKAVEQDGLEVGRTEAQDRADAAPASNAMNMTESRTDGAVDVAFSDPTPASNGDEVSADEADEKAVEQAISPVQSPGKSDRADKTYQRMISIIDTLQGHPANVFFRSPLQVENRAQSMLAYLRQNQRPVVDLFVIKDNLTNRKYGRLDPFTAVSADLNHMWSNAKAFYGQSSEQARCAEFLSHFSNVIMAEWRRETANVKLEGSSLSEMRKGASGADRVKKAQDDVSSNGRGGEAAAKFIRDLTHGTNRAGKTDRGFLTPRSPNSKGSSFQRATQSHEQQAVPKLPASPLDVSNEDAQKTLYASKAPLPSLPSQQRQAVQDLPITPRSHAFLSTLFAKGCTSGRSMTASADTVAKLQQQFGPFSKASSKDVQPQQQKRGLKRPGPPLVARRPSAQRPRSTKKAHVASSDEAAEPHTVPVVTITDESIPAVQGERDASPKKQDVIYHEVLEQSKHATQLLTPAASDEKTPDAQSSQMATAPSDEGATAADEEDQHVEWGTPFSSPRAAVPETRVSPRLRAGRRGKGGAATASSLSSQSLYEEPKMQPPPPPTEKDTHSARPTRGRIATRASRRAQAAAV